MDKVYLGSFRDYSSPEIREFVLKGLGDAGLKMEGARVLLKPNLLSGKSPERAVTTHPGLVRAVAELVRDMGAEVFIGDSPGYESTERVLRLSGLMDVVESLDLRVARFDGRVARKWEGISPYKGFVLGEDPRSYDVIINLPKFKTHAMMGLTLGVKNCFGFVPGKEKGKWHLRAGKDRILFASLLADIHNLVNPSVTILDGIIGMDGEGPSNGRVRRFNLLAMSTNAYALDREIEKRCGIASPLPVSLVADRHGLSGEYQVVDLGAPAIEGVLLPSEMATDWAVPALVKRVLRRIFVKKPVLRGERCKGCGLCAGVCPAGALVMESGLPRFDYKVCISCYCCQEMCPEGAIKV